MNVRAVPKVPVERDPSEKQFDARPQQNAEAHPRDLDPPDALENEIGRLAKATFPAAKIREWKDHVTASDEPMLDQHAKITLKLTWGEMMNVCLKACNGEEDKANALAKALDGQARAHLSIAPVSGQATTNDA